MLVSQVHGLNLRQPIEKWCLTVTQAARHSEDRRTVCCTGATQRLFYTGTETPLRQVDVCMSTNLLPFTVTFLEVLNTDIRNSRTQMYLLPDKRSMVIDSARVTRPRREALASFDIRSFVLNA